MKELNPGFERCRRIGLLLEVGGKCGGVEGYVLVGDFRLSRIVLFGKGFQKKSQEGMIILVGQLIDIQFPVGVEFGRIGFFLFLRAGFLGGIGIPGQLQLIQKAEIAVSIVGAAFFFKFPVIICGIFREVEVFPWSCTMNESKLPGMEGGPVPDRGAPQVDIGQIVGGKICQSRCHPAFPCFRRIG